MICIIKYSCYFWRQCPWGRHRIWKCIISWAAYSYNYSFPCYGIVLVWTRLYARSSVVIFRCWYCRTKTGIRRTQSFDKVWRKEVFSQSRIIKSYFLKRVIWKHPTVAEILRNLQRVSKFWWRLTWGKIP